jgi:hypothetical protein
MSVIPWGQYVTANSVSVPQVDTTVHQDN